MESSVSVLGDKTHVAGSERAPDEHAIDQEPRSVYEVLTRQMLEQVKTDVAEIKNRVNALMWTVLGALLVELLMRVVG